MGSLQKQTFRMHDPPIQFSCWSLILGTSYAQRFQELQSARRLWVFGCRAVHWVYFLYSGYEPYTFISSTDDKVSHEGSSPRSTEDLGIFCCEGGLRDGKGGCGGFVWHPDRCNRFNLMFQLHQATGLLPEQSLRGSWLSVRIVGRARTSVS